MNPRIVLTQRRRSVWKRVRQWTGRGNVWIILRGRSRDIWCEFRPWKGWCWRAAYPKGESGVAARVIAPPPELCVKKVKPGGAAAGGDVNHLAAMETNVFKDLVNLVAHCAVIRYEDKSVRRPGWWTAKTQGAGWIVEVKDPDSACRLQATGNTLDDALALADLLIGGEDAPWEPDPWLAQQRPGAKKKGS